MPLTTEHRRMLEVESGISSGVIEMRGYYSEHDAKKLSELGFSNDQCRAPALVIPVWTVDAVIGGYQIRPDDPRERDGKKVKYETLPKWSMRLDCPPACRADLDDPSIPLIITEGVKKADAAAVRGQCCIALLGVWNFRGQNDHGGIAELADWDRIPLKTRRGPGRIIYIVFDSDVMQKDGVRKAMRRLAAVLKRRGAGDVRPILLPSVNGQKVGLDDYFASGGTWQHLKENCVDKDLLRASQIVVNGRSLPDISSDALKALSESNVPARIFVRAGELVRIEHDERGVVKIGRLKEPSLKGELARAAEYVKIHKDGPVECAPSDEVTKDILSLGAWPDVPPVVAVTRAPVLSTEGVITMSSGYCPRSRMYVASKETWPEWTGTVEEAVEFIFGEVLVDFPFAGQADRAHALALMLLPIVRPVISGPTPLHLIDAPVQSTGKTLLAKVCLMPTQGTEIFTTPGTRDEEEWRKRITSSLLDGRAYILFDNLTRKVESEHLANALTANEWSDRGLGASTNVNCSVRCVWVATGNNADLAQDILERTVWIRIDARVPNPADRKVFRHEHIEGWIGDNRPLIVSALCKIVQHWCDLGQPKYSGRITSKYFQWSTVIGGILSSAGVDGFLANLEELRRVADSEEPAWLDFYNGWWTHYGGVAVKAGELLDEAKAIDEIAAKLEGAKGESGQKARLGRLIRSRVGIVTGDMLRIEIAGERAGSISYRMSKLRQPDSDDLFEGQTPPNPTTFEANPTMNPTNFSDSNGGVSDSALDSNDGVLTRAYTREEAHNTLSQRQREKTVKPHQTPSFEPEPNGSVGGVSDDLPKGRAKL